jgi:hypothetical protein
MGVGGGYLHRGQCAGRRCAAGRLENLFKIEITSLARQASETTLAYHQTTSVTNVVA